MGLSVKISPEKVLKVCELGIIAEEARWLKYRTDTIKSISEGLRKKAEDSFWRKLFGAPKKGYDCDQEAIAIFDNPSFHSDYFWKHHHHMNDIMELEAFASAARNSDHQLIEFTRGDAGTILALLDKHLTPSA